MPLRLGTSLGNARFGISTKWPKGISLGANIPLGVDPKAANKKTIQPLQNKFRTPGNNITRMVAQVKNSNFYSRPCLYKVRITPPALVNFNALQDIALNCETVTFPGLQLSTKQHKTYGIGREYAYERLLTPIQMSFYVSDNMKEFQLFQSWMQKIMKPNGRFNYFNEYTGKIEIFQCSNRVNTDEEDLPVMMTAELNQAYPKTIGDLALGHGLKDQIHKVPITIVYNEIKFKDYKNSGSSMGTAIGEGVGHLKEAFNSFAEAGTMLQDKMSALKLPKLGTLLKKKSHFLPGSLDSIRGGGGGADLSNALGAPLAEMEGMLKDAW